MSADNGLHRSKTQCQHLLDNIEQSLMSVVFGAIAYPHVNQTEESSLEKNLLLSIDTDTVTLFTNADTLHLHFFSINSLVYFQTFGRKP